MKNLKFKVILAILLVIMSVGTCFAAGGVFTDIDDTNYEIPVYALRELDIMDGYPNNTFQPSKTVTRAEMIKMIVTAYGLENLAEYSDEESTGYADVDMDYFVSANTSVKHWASGYIYVAKEYGFIDESPNKNFYPDDNVTYADAITYCLRILGYKYEIESKGTRPTNYIAKAQDLKLLKGLEINSYSDSATRGNVAILLWNVMNTRVWKIIGSTAEGIVAGPSVTLLEAKHPDKVDDIEILIEKLTEILPTGIKLETSSKTVCLGIENTKVSIYDLVKVTILPEDATERQVNYSNSNPDVLKLDKGGFVLVGKSVGQTVITVETLNGIKAEFTVNVVDHDSFAKKEMKYDDNNHWELHTCTYCGIEIGKKNVESHTYVNGKCMCGKSEPQPTEILPTGITLSKSSTQMCIGANGVDTKLRCSVLSVPTITPENATDKTVTWTSSNNSIVGIENGYIIAKQKGSIVLTAKTVNGLTANCNVEIVDHQCSTGRKYEYDENTHWQMSICILCLDDIEKTNIESHTFVNGVCECGKTSSMISVSTLEFETDIMNLELGRTKQLNLKIIPDDANEKITYTSNNKSYVTVDSNGKIKAAKAGGIATITAKTESGKTATCKVVVPKGVVSKMVLGTSSNKDSLNSDDVWVSSDESVVTFESEKYIAKKLGKCTLTAYLKDNPNILTAKVEVEVVETLGSMSIEVKGEKNYTLEVGEEIDLEAEIISTVENNDGSKYKLTWKSSDSNIATVKGNNRKAKLIAKNPGTCDIVVSHEGMKITIKVTVIDPNASVEYEDVKEDDWFEESVKYVTNNNLMNGMGDNKFSPSSNMTRGMIVTVLYRMSESGYNGKSTFVDVKESEYYSSAVAWAAENEIVNGIGDNKFAPNAEITREQLIVILYRYAKVMKVDVSVGENTNILPYDDFNEIAEYSISAFQWGCGEGIISGRTSTTLSPKGTASRAEVATMLMRFMED